VGGKTVIYRFFEVSAKYRAAISSRSTTCNLVCDCEDRKTMGEQRERERERERERGRGGREERERRSRGKRSGSFIGQGNEDEMLLAGWRAWFA